MPKFTVEVKEVWSRSFEVEADTPDEAREKANEIVESTVEGENFEYSHTLDPDDWTVRDEQGNFH